MTEAKFTPGPWKASETEPRGDWCIHAAGIPWQLAYIGASSKIDWPLEANARLIAAAPDMLDLVIQYRNDLKRPPNNDSCERRLEAIEAVLAKLYPTGNNAGEYPAGNEGLRS